MARRVDKRFLVILTIALVAGVGGVILANWWSNRDNPAKALERARELEKSGKIVDAASAYVRAADSDPKNVELRIKAGDMMREATRERIEFARDFTTQWDKALEIDPKSRPAAERLYKNYRDLVLVNAVPDAYTKLESAARRLAKLDPANAEAAAFVQIAKVGKWITDRSERDETELSNAPGAKTQDAPDTQSTTAPAILVEQPGSPLEELAKAYEAHPELVDAPYFRALAYRRMGDNRNKGATSIAGQPFYKMAEQILVDALKTHPDDPRLNLRYCQYLMQVYGRGTMDESVRQRRLAAAKKAADGLPKADREYVDAQIAMMASLPTDSKVSDAEKMLRDTIAAKPDSQLAVLTLAQVLRRIPKRDEAIALLSKPLPDDPSTVGYFAILRPRYEFRQLLELGRAYSDATIAPAVDEATLKANVTKLVDVYNQFVGKFPKAADDAEGLELKARTLIRGVNREERRQALPVLQQAYNRLSERGEPDPELTILLAQALADSEQRNAAILVLAPLVRDNPNILGARRMLATLYIMEGKTGEARTQLDALERLTPEDAALIPLQLKLLDPDRDKDRIVELLKKRPEGTDIEKYNKAILAMQKRQDDIAEKLLSQITGNPKLRVNSVSLLASIYVRTNRQENAEAVLNAALEAAKDDPRLQLLHAQIVDKVSRDQLNDMVNNLLMTEADPVERELLAAKNAQGHGQTDVMLQHLQAAEKLAPSDPRVLQSLFNIAVDRKEWDNARRYRDKLVSGNLDGYGGLTFEFHYAMDHGRALLATGNRVEANKAFLDARAAADALVKKAGELQWSWVSQGQSLLGLGQPTEAKDSFNAAAQRQPTPESQIGLIDCANALGQTTEAGRLLEEGVQRWPENGILLDNLLRFQENNGNADKALPVREKIAKNSPNAIGPQLAYANAILRAAVDQTSRSAPDKARMLFDKARGLFAESKQKWPNKQTIYAMGANIEMADTKPAAAIAILTELAARPAWAKRAEPQLMLAQVYSSDGKVGESEAAMLKAIDLVPKPEDKRMLKARLAEFYVRSSSQAPENLDKGLSLLGQLVTETSDNPSVSNALAQQLIDLQVNNARLADADKLLTRQLQGRPKDPVLLTLRGMWFLNNRDIDPKTRAQKAIEQFGAALDANPDSIDARLRRGKTLLNPALNRVDDAIADFKGVLNRDPTNVDAHVAMAAAQRAHGEFDAARRELEDALRLEPGRKDVRIQLIDLYAGSNPVQVEILLEGGERIPGLQNDPEWLALYARWQMQRKQFAEASERFKRVAALRPRDVAAKYEYAQSLLAAQKYQNALAVVDEIGKLPADQQLEWRTHLLRSQIRQAMKDTAGALSEFEAALNGAKDDQSSLQVVRGFIASAGVKTAIDPVEQRAKAEPRWTPVVALLYFVDGQTERAWQTAKGFIASDEFAKLDAPNQLEAYRTAAMISTADQYTAKGADRAISAHTDLLNFINSQIAKGIEIPPVVRMPILNNLASFLADHPVSPSPERALQFSREAYQLMKSAKMNLLPVADTYGWTLVRAGKLDEGINVLLDALESDDPNKQAHETHFHLAEAYLMQNKVDAAVAQYAQARSDLDELKRAGGNLPQNLWVRLDEGIKKAEAARPK